ncbi:hypothetical protein K440DRAFT_642369 [Wilcoxina mikolae CBS 423.85]|nr:hypothetical protein K440DRAFT_642369 [Wilcoxina mikolae CBS 423.85]
MAASQASSMHMFALPPPALPEPLAVDNSSNIAAVAAAPTTASRGKKRRASSQQQPQQQQQPPVTLPPPPTRTRKIIQMKPTPSSASSPPISPSTSRTPTTKPKPTPKTTTTTPPSSTTTSTTSRKVARKTAHSLIERRRRSKMNAEFESLKNLVPACRGVEMHKLAILQASIEYVRYLEGCVKELQKATGGGNCCSPPPVFSPRNDDDEGESEDGDGDGDEEDVEMKEPLLQQQPQCVSNSSSSGCGGGRRGTEDYSNYTTAPSSAASVASDFTPVHSATTSPVFTHPTAQGPRLPSISPMLFPQHQPPLCMEATAGALLLLADEGRREDGRGGIDRPVLSRGMSVKDLLSS